MLSSDPDISRLIVIIGPSGVGKGTLINRLMNEVGSKIQFSISHTTRKMREGEVDGKDYYFVSQEKFLEILNKDGFVEYNFFNENYYGTSKQEIKRIAKENNICLLEVDITGAKKIYQAGLHAFFLGVFPPNSSVLRERLNSRGTDSHEQINQRLKIAYREVEELNTVNFLNAKIINDDIEISYSHLKSILFSFYPELNPDQMTKINMLKDDLTKDNSVQVQSQLSAK